MRYLIPGRGVAPEPHSSARGRHYSTAALGAVALMLGACSVEDVDRTQPDKVQKCLFFEGGCESTQPLAAREPTEFYYNQTVIDVPATSDVAFVGDTNFQITNRVIFDIQEDHLYVYRSFPWIEADGDGQVNGGDDVERPGSTGPTGAPIAIFPIESHFDVQREYNASTGEQTNVIVENTSDRPWYERDYMRVDWSMNLVGDINFTMSSVDGAASRVVPQEDSSRDLGKEATKIGPDYIDFVQHVALESQTIPGSEVWFGFPVPTCWLFSRIHSDCQGGVVKVRNSFAKVPESNYRPTQYSDTRLNKFGAFRTERYKYDDEYGIVEPTVDRLANRWNLWKGDADCYDAEAERPYGACQPSDLRTIVFYVAEDHPEHLREAAVTIGDAWNQVFRQAVMEANGYSEAQMADVRMVRVCPNNPVQAGDPAECGEEGLNPQIGDIRYSFNYYVPEDHESSPLGFGPSNVDPLTGEIISANAYFYGAPARWLSRRTLDIFKVSEGMLDRKDLGDGTAIAQRLPRPDARFATRQGSLKLDMDKVRDSVDRLHIREKAERLRALVRSGEAHHDEREGKLALLKQSSLNELAVTEEMRQAFGQGLLSQGGAADAFAAADEMVNYLDDDRLFGLYRESQAFLRQGPGGRHIHMADEYFEERYLDLFRELREQFVVDGELDEAAALDYIEARVFIDTQLHEVGHTLGMMHNFAGSADAVNFAREWWDMRAQAGLVEGKRPTPEWNILDEDGFDAALQAGMRALQSSTSMEYMSTYGTDLDPGRYDVAWVKYVYLDTVEIFDTDHPDVNITRERAQRFQRGALHYTFYPELVSDAASYEARVDAMYQRRNVGFRQVEANPTLVEVPYRFCGDAYAGSAADCERWDQGLDNYERTQKKVADFQNYYWFDAFKRERLAFGTDVYSYISRLYSRTYKPMLDQYKHWVNEELIVRDDEPCVWWEDGERQEDPDRFVAEACGLAGYVGSAEALNLLASVVTTPDVGCYVRLQRGCYETVATNTADGGLADERVRLIDSNPSYCDGYAPMQPEDYPAATTPPFGSERVGKLKIERNSSYFHLDDTTQCATDDSGEPTFEIRDFVSGDVISEPALQIDLGTAKPSRSVYDRESYGYHFYWKPVVMGSWWEKWMAIKALSDPYTDFKGVDASADTASFLISLTTLFSEDINQVISGAVLEEGEVYGRVLHQGEVKDVPVLELFQGSLFDPSRARDPVVDPDQEYTFRLLALMNAAYQSSYITDDYDFAETLKVGRSFSQSDIELPADILGDPERFQSVRDPQTGEIWWAVKVERQLNGTDAPNIYSTAYESIRRIKQRYYVGGVEGPGTELLPGVAEWRPRSDLRFLNIIRGTGQVFGDAFISAGDVGF